MELLHEIDAHNGPVGVVAFAPDGQALLSGGADRLIKVWSPENWTVKSELASHQNAVVCLAFSPDGQQLASGSIDTMIKLWTYPSGELTATMAGHTATVSDLCYSPDGSLLLSASYDATARLWSVEHAAEAGIHMKHQKNIAAAIFTPDGSAMLTAGLGPPIHLWLLPTGSWAASLKDSRRRDVHQTAVGSLALAPSGEMMVSGGWDGKAAFWTVPGWTNRKTVRAIGLGIHSITFHPGERHIAASSDDEVAVVDIESGKRVFETKLDVKGIHSIRFSPDGSLLAAACNDGKLRIWDVSSLS